MRCLLLLAVLTLLLRIGSAKAEFVTGNTLWTECNQQSALCYGYVMALVDAMQGWRTGPNLQGHVRVEIGGQRACIPDNLTGGQAVDVVLKALRDHPEQRHFNGASLIASALAESFPCKAQ